MYLETSIDKVKENRFQVNKRKKQKQLPTPTTPMISYLPTPPLGQDMTQGQIF